MFKLFLDTNILISGTFWKGSSYKVLIEISKRRLLGFTTNQILDEYSKILKREFNHSEEEAAERVEKLFGILALVSPKETLNVIKADPSDNRVLEGAAAASADFIISYDHHLLDLKAFRNIAIIKPEEILRKLGNNLTNLQKTD